MNFSCAKKIVFFAVTVYAPQLLAYDVDCNKISISAEVDACSRINRSNAEVLLSKSYTDAVLRAKKQYEEHGELLKEYSVILKASQRAWVDSRDADCRLNSFEIDDRYPAHLTMVNDCISRMDEDRSLYLQGLLPTLP